LNEILDLISQMADDQDKFTDAAFSQLVDDDAEQGPASQWDQRFGLGVGMRPELGTGTGNGYDGFHALAGR
jgi:hypothetical protein